MRQGREPRTSPSSVAPLRPGVTPSRLWAWPGATGGRRGGGGDRWRSARARARSGHGRLGAALRVVAALLRAGEPVPPLVRGVPRSVRAASAAPASAPRGPQIGARTRDFSPAHTCVPLAGGLSPAFMPVDSVRGYSPYYKSPARPRSLSCPGQSLSSHPFHNWVN